MKIKINKQEILEEAVRFDENNINQNQGFLSKASDFLSKDDPRTQAVYHQKVMKTQNEDLEKQAHDLQNRINNTMPGATRNQMQAELSNILKNRDRNEQDRAFMKEGYTDPRQREQVQQAQIAKDNKISGLKIGGVTGALAGGGLVNSVIGE